MRASPFIALLAVLLSAVPLHAAARTCKVAIASDDAMKFDQSEIRVGADCSKVTLTLTHTGGMPAEIMGHNWVLSKTSDLNALATAGGKAGAQAHYVPPGDARAIAHTKVIGGGESTTVTFSTAGLSQGGDYTFFCSFPGHWAIMKGTFVFG